MIPIPAGWLARRAGDAVIMAPAGAGDAAGEALHETIADDYYLSWDARRIVRDGERELERRGQR